jgi:branched-chain amino acid transport system ATP-binding protein
MEVTNGSTLGIIGPNGAGKTTLFHALSGDLSGRTGTVSILGRQLKRNTSSRVAKLGLGKLFQDVRVFPNLTVRENLQVAVHTDRQRAWHSSWRCWNGYQGLPEQRSRVAAVLDRIELADQSDALAGSLSFGNQKTLALGRLMVGSFSILLLDEPMAGLSPRRAQLMGTLIEELVHQRGTTVLLIEHNMQHVRRLCRETLVLNQGMVVRHGPTEDVLGDPDVREICLGL